MLQVILDLIESIKTAGYRENTKMRVGLTFENMLNYLTSLIAGKAPILHNHPISHIDTLQESLDNKLDFGSNQTLTEQQKLTGITNLGLQEYNKLTYIFNNAIDFEILGINHKFDRIPAVSIYNNIGQQIFTSVVINQTTLDVSISFKQPITGKVILS